MIAQDGHFESVKYYKPVASDSDTFPKLSRMSNSQVYLIYDERMELHQHMDELKRVYHVERPERVVSIMEKLVSLQSHLLNYRQKKASEDSITSVKPPFIHLSCEPAGQETIELAHSTEYYNRLKVTSKKTEEELKSIYTIDCTVADDGIKEDGDDEDMYFCNDTFQTALLAAGGVVQCVDAVTSPSADSTRALAVVRPPGHHACHQKAMGFCFFNSVVVAAKHAIQSQRARKVVILDWDIHHGNGSQDLTYNDGDILYISLHRKCGTKFFPGTGDPEEVGGDEFHPEAIGLNVNVAWRNARMGNVEYAAAMSELVLPLLQGFDPDLVLISCGLDAAKGDLIGDCELLPDMYYLMTMSILETLGVDIPIVVALEGGYNTTVISTCMEAVAYALLDEDWNDGTKALDITTQDTILFTKGGESAENRLEIGRRLLAKYWDYYSENKSHRGKIKVPAIRDINRTIRCLQNTPYWSTRGVGLEEISKQIPPVSRMTRSKGKDIDNLDGIESALRSFSIR